MPIALGSSHGMGAYSQLLCAQELVHVLILAVAAMIIFFK
jgi:hypothetical protein